MIMSARLLLFAAVILTAGSCSGTPKTAEPAGHDATPQQPRSDIIRENHAADDDQNIARIVRDWNSSLNNRDSRLARTVYSDKVYFYGEELSGERCIEIRNKNASKTPGWKQFIDEPINVSDLGDGRKLASFTKSSIASGRDKPHHHEAYLIFARDHRGEWRIAEESDQTTDKNLRKRASAKRIPAEAISGDFDGDGRTDHLWVTATYDDDGYAVGPVRLASDNPALTGLEWDATRGAMLLNLGKLDGDGRDYLGVIPAFDSSWCTFLTYVNRGRGKWHQPIKEFTVWLGDEDYVRVRRSSRPGYVVIRANDSESDDVDDHFIPVEHEVKLR